MTVTPAAPGYKRLTKLSISRILDFERCPIYFYRRAVLGEPTPSTGSQELGIAVHDLAENYLRDGKAPHDGKAGALLRVGLHLLPVIGSVRVEEWLTLPAIGACDAVPAGVPLTGKADYFAPPGVTSPAAWAHYTGDPATRAALAALAVKPADVVFVGDHKTTSDLRYAKTPAELATDPQLSVYAVAIAAAAGATPRAAVLEHVQYRTKGIPIAQRARAVVPWSAVEATFKRVDALAGRALTLASVIDRDTVNVPANARPTSCGMYGGCPFASTCAFSPEHRSTPATLGRIPTMATPTTTTSTPTANARRAAMLGTPPAIAPSVNAPDAAPPSPAVDPLDGFIALGEALEMTGGDRVTEAYARKLITRIGCNFDAVIAIADHAAGRFVLDGGFVVLTAAAPVEVAATPSPVAEVDIVEVKPGDWRCYDANGNTIRDASQAFRWPSREAALAAITPAAVEAAPAVVPVAPAAPVVTAPVAVEPAPKSTTVNPEAAAAVNALADALDTTGTLAAVDVDAVIKKALGLARLRAPTRDNVIALGVSLGAFVVTPTGIASTDAAPVEAPAARELVEASNAASDAIETAAAPKAAPVVSVADVAATPTAKRADPAPAPRVSPPDEAPAVAHAPNDGSIVYRLIVLVDCLPASSSGATELAAILAPIEDEVADEAGVSHYGLIDYGKGPKAVASKFLIAATRSRLDGIYTISSAHPCAGEVLAILARFGAFVIRGVRA